jgi:LysR family hydrogen peroxide-inducible transcriptional activator
MEIHQLKYFVAIVETGGFSRAAERCNVSQPSLSQQIQKLERELGGRLFDRLGRGVVLTEAGQNLLPRARAILAELKEIEVGLADSIRAGHGRLAVGFIPTVAPYLLPGVLQNMAEKYPHAELSVHEDLTDNLLQDLVSGKLDVGIMSTPINNKHIRTEDLFSEPLLVASSRHHEFAHAMIQVKELEAFPFIALSEVHCLGEQVHSFCYQQDVNLEIVCHTTQLSTVGSCVALGLGVSLVPHMFAACDASGEIEYRRVRAPVPSRKIVAATHKNRSESLLGRAFIELVKDEYFRLAGI